MIRLQKLASSKSFAQVMFLNINRKITSVVSGVLNPALQRDVLMVGTQTSLMVYDVEEGVSKKWGAL